MSRPQFTLRTLLVAMLVVAAFLGGMVLQKRLDKPRLHLRFGSVSLCRTTWWEIMELKDGTRWHREYPQPEPK